MAEWLKAHAWKAKRATDAKDTPKPVNAHAISGLTLQNNHSVCVGNLDVLQGSQPHVSQPYHNRSLHLESHVR
jgi:hypothetical protein